MDKKEFFKFYVAKHPACLGLPAETAGILYVGNIINENVYWFDNNNEEWHKSLYTHKNLINDPEFKPVKYFDNGYISSDDAVLYLINNKKINIPTKNENEFYL